MTGCKTGQLHLKEPSLFSEASWLLHSPYNVFLQLLQKFFTSTKIFILGFLKTVL